MRLRYLLPLVFASAAFWSCQSPRTDEAANSSPLIPLTEAEPHDADGAAPAAEMPAGEIALADATHGQQEQDAAATETLVVDESNGAVTSLGIGSAATTTDAATTDAAAQPANAGDAKPVRQDAPAAAPAAQDSVTLEQRAERLQLLEQRRTELVAQFVRTGDTRLDMADFHGALEQYSQAHDVLQGARDAGNQRELVMNRLAKVKRLMGDDYSLAAAGVEDATQRLMIKSAQARLAAEQSMLDGDAALRAGKHELAVRHYREAAGILRFNPMLAGGSIDEKIVANKIATASRLADEARAAAEKQKVAAAQAAAAKAEAEQKNFRENQLKQVYTEAYRAFQAEDYPLAAQLGNQILMVDNGNPIAQELVDISLAAKHQKIEQTTLRRMREEWILTFEGLNQSANPQTRSVEFDDLERWKIVNVRRPPEFSSKDPEMEAEKTAVLRRLSDIQIAPHFGKTDEPAKLADVAQFLQNYTNINFLLSPKVRELDEETTSIHLETRERSVKSVLDLIAEMREQIKWKVEDGMVKFVTPEEMKGGQVLKMYEVNDLIRGVQEFPGGDINVIPSNGLEKSDEKVEEREALVVTADNLDAMIRGNVDPASWDADAANSLKISNGTLIVNQTPEVHAKIDRLLADLREATGIMVDIQARFLKVEDNFLEDIGVDFKGLGSPGKGTNGSFNDFGDASAQNDLGQEIGQDPSNGFFYDDGADGSAGAHIEQLYDSELGNSNFKADGGLSFQWTFLNDLEMELILRAVSKSERIQLVTAPRVLVFNTARANLTVLNQVAYVRDYDVEIAQGASIADPLIDVVQDGVILDVKPVVSADRRFITLEVRPTVAELKRPIAELATGLGSATAVTLQLPELEISRVRTTLPIPDGGTVLLGGFKLHESTDQRSGIPFLNKIPFLSFLFERKGNYVSNRKLLILLKANIVIPTEQEPTPAQLGILPGSKR
jgi:type II secretory pathway component GspD/PulD (secretin)